MVVAVTTNQKHRPVPDGTGLCLSFAEPPPGRWNRDSRITEREKSGASTDIEKYTYDALGRLITAKKGITGTDDSVSRSLFAYDDLSRVTSENRSIVGASHTSERPR